LDEPYSGDEAVFEHDGAGYGFDNYSWRIMKTLFLLLLLTLPAIAQQRQADALAHLSASSGAGLGPVVGAGGRIVLPASSRFSFTGEAFALPRYPKEIDRCGKAFSLDGSLRLRLGRSGVAVGGIQRTTAYFSQDSRTATHAFGGFGAWYRDRALVYGFLASPDQTRYRLWKAGVKVEMYEPIGESRWLFVVLGSVEGLFYRLPGTGERLSGVKAGMSAGVGRRF
jgi:hypothetical protein